MGFENMPVVGKVFVIISIFFGIVAFLCGIFMKAKKKDNNTENSRINNTSNTISPGYQPPDHLSSSTNNPPRYNHLTQEYFLTTDMTSNQQSLPYNRSEESNQDHQAIEIPSTTHNPPRYNHLTQEYFLTTEMVSNQQTSSNRLKESNPPPSYNDHKTDIHLSNDT